MGSTQEVVVRSLIAAMNADDRDGIAGHFAEDATWHFGAWRAPILGRTAIRAMLDQLSGVDFRYEIRNMASTEALVFTELVDSHRRDGKDVTIHWCSVVEIDGRGMISCERDYWDAKELEAQLSEVAGSAGVRGLARFGG